MSISAILIDRANEQKLNAILGRINNNKVGGKVSLESLIAIALDGVTDRQISELHDQVYAESNCIDEAYRAYREAHKDVSEAECRRAFLD